MKARDIMTPQPRCCSADDTLEHAARIMLEEDVGEVPVLDAKRHLAGVITDRDIVVRCVASGDRTDRAMVGQCMTAPARTCRDDASLEDVANLMKGERIRRVPIVDGNGEICGIVALADLERTSARSLKAEVSERVSTPH
jgi:CBS domain-containing protein